MTTRRGFLGILRLAAAAPCVMAAARLFPRPNPFPTAVQQIRFDSGSGEAWGTWWIDEWHDSLETRRQRVLDYIDRWNRQYPKKIALYDYRLVDPSDTIDPLAVPYTTLKWYT